MADNAELRDLDLHEAFLAWLTAPLEEQATKALMKAYRDASIKARDLTVRALHSIAVPVYTEVWRKTLLAHAKDHRNWFRHALRDALEQDHVGYCDNNTCDINAAHKHGYYAWAAHLLAGATECEATSKVYPQYIETFLEPGEFEAHLQQECKELLEIEHIACVACNAPIWQPDTRHGDSCGNCGVQIRAVKEDDDAEGDA